MAMTVVVTRDVAARFRGFLASAMLEIAPGVYTAPDLPKAVRERIWRVCEDWFTAKTGGSIVMTWRDPAAPGGQAILTLGLPPCDLREHEGLVLLRRPLKTAPAEATEEEAPPPAPQESA